MAQTTTAIVKRAELYMDGIQSFLDDFDILAEDWETMEEGPKAGFSLEWDQLILGLLPELDKYVKRETAYRPAN